MTLDSIRNQIPNPIIPLELSDAEWKAKLTPEQYRILRRHGTEVSCTSPLWLEKRPGLFRCAGCALPLFYTETKFESGSGWPSFFGPIAPQVIQTSTDTLIGYPRTEVHCTRCNGHLGHVFEDGPPPSHLRYCINGEALLFTATEEL